MINNSQVIKKIYTKYVAKCGTVKALTFVEPWKLTLKGWYILKLIITFFALRTSEQEVPIVQALDNNCTCTLLPCAKCP